jgi:hypothetical protein
MSIKFCKATNGSKPLKLPRGIESKNDDVVVIIGRRMENV